MRAPATTPTQSPHTVCANAPGLWNSFRIRTLSSTHAFGSCAPSHPRRTPAHATEHCHVSTVTCSCRFCQRIGARAGMPGVQRGRRAPGSSNVTYEISKQSAIHGRLEGSRHAQQSCGSSLESTGLGVQGRFTAASVRPDSMPGLGACGFCCRS